MTAKLFSATLLAASLSLIGCDDQKKEDMKKEAHKIEESTKAAAENAKDKMEHGVDVMKEKIKDGAEVVKEKAHDAFNTDNTHHDSSTSAEPASQAPVDENK